MSQAEPLLGAVVAVVVTYHPDLAVLSAQIDALRPQVEALIVVDNGSGPAFRAWIEKEDRCIPLLLEKNIGLAAAQNRGIAEAIKKGAKSIIFFDQDSLPPATLVASLQGALQALKRSGKTPGAVGPRFIDRRQNNMRSFTRTEGLCLVRVGGSADEGTIPVDYVIASGSLIEVEVLERVGLMDEALFIDYVDIEWGLRAKAKGFPSFGVCSAEMEHSLGENPVSFGKRKIPLHSPLRHYYLFRNRIALYKRSGIPLNWKLVDGFRLIRNFVFYALYAKPRATHIRMMIQGLWHGIRGRLGAYAKG